MTDQIYHFTGIKGSGMSALALILKGKGYNVQGSDVAEYFFTQKGLDDAKIPLYEFNTVNFEPNTTVIAGNAFGDDHLELVKARELGLNVIRYHNFLGEFIKGFTSVAVTGSHGKTTTTGLLSHVLKQLKPTSYLIGDGTGVGKEDAQYFVLEACEYRHHFMAYATDYAIITNVDFDHPDYYKNIEDVFSAFQDFSKQVSKNVVACGEDHYLKRLKNDSNTIFYGFSDENDVIAKNIVRNQNGSQFDVYVNQSLYGTFFVPAFGNHNILNALAVITICYLEQFNAVDVAKALSSFSGVKRRFSQKTVGDMIIFDDYAHHPAEIAATLDAITQKHPEKEVIAVFQPHTYSRTVALLDEFASVLSTADHVFLFDIFGSAREESGNISISDLANKITKPVKVLEKEQFSDLFEFHNAVIAFMGAGDIDKISEKYVDLLSHLQNNTN